MTSNQLVLCLDRFEVVRNRIDARVDAEAERALMGIKSLAEHHRRSLGQIVRWQQKRTTEAARA